MGSQMMTMMLSPAGLAVLIPYFSYLGEGGKYLIKARRKNWMLQTKGNSSIPRKWAGNSNSEDEEIIDNGWSGLEAGNSEWLSGWCIDPKGNDRDNGALLLPDTYYRNDCLKKCQSFDWATACEFSYSDSKCTVHSTNINGASGDKKYFCHLLSLSSNCIRRGVGLIGHFIGTISNIRSSLECACKCKEKVGCAFMTYSYKGRICTLIKGPTKSIVGRYDKGAYSGSKDCCEGEIFGYACYQWTEKQKQRILSHEIKPQKQCTDQGNGFIFSGGDDSLAPGCGTCGCCRPKQPCPARSMNYYHPDKDFVKPEVHENIKSWEDCSQLCQNRWYCKFWTWHSPLYVGEYRLKCVTIRLSTKFVSYSNTISGTRQCVAAVDYLTCPEFYVNYKGRQDPQWHDNIRGWQ